MRDFGAIDTVRFAESFGATGLRVTSADELSAALRQALDTPGRVIVDVPVDYSDNKSLGAVLNLESFE
ncbi:thiamine pyrophosphate-dependent enzyme [Streptosporangium subroseum]